MVELCDQNSDIKHKVRHLLKLSPEKWDEVCQHALSAVVPDFRPRVWWCPGIQGGMLFACKNGAVLAESPIGYVRREREGGMESVLTMQQSEGLLFSVLPKLKTQAMQVGGCSCVTDACPLAVLVHCWHRRIDLWMQKVGTCLYSRQVAPYRCSARGLCHHK